MTKLLNTVETIGYKYLSEFGFSDEQLKPLLALGIRDIRKTLEKLYHALAKKPTDVEEINHLLHTFKGLLLQLGHQELADEINERRSNIDKEQIYYLQHLLFKDISEG
jgi:HPt (histidine-containing phosphotransfer) domain-containing protein